MTPSGRGKRPATDAAPVEVSANDEPRSPEEKLAAQGLTLVGNKPEEFGAYMQAEMAKWAKVIQEAGIKIE